MSLGTRLFRFAGIQPRLDDRLLRRDQAAVAHDVDLGRGDLCPMRYEAAIKQYPDNVVSVLDTEAVCEYAVWDELIDVELGQPVCSDIGMVFWIEEGVAYEATRVELCNGQRTALGVPCPANAPGGGAGGGDGCATACRFRYTYVNKYGQEGPPSPSSPLTVCDELSVPGGGGGAPAGGFIRYYRAVAQHATGDETSAGEVGAYSFAGDSINGVHGTQEDAEILPSTRWRPPPTGVTALTICPKTNSLFLAKGNVVYISEPGQYHAFPGDRDLALLDNVVAMEAYQDGVVILTDGHPYYIAATHHADSGPVYTTERHPRPIPCVSKASVSVGSSGVVWSSDDGLFLMGETRFGLQIKCLSEELFHDDDWFSLQPDTVRGVAHEGAYYFTGDGEVTDQTTGFTTKSYKFVFDDQVYEHPDNVRMVSLSVEPDMWHTTRKGDLMYSIGVNLYRWNPRVGTAVPYKYVTRVTTSRTNLNYAAAKVISRGEGYLEFRIWKIHCGVHQLLYSRMLTHCRPFRLPRCIWGDEHYIEVSGTKCVQEIHIATSEQDLTLVQNSDLPKSQDKQW